MDVIYKDIEALVEKELNAANETYPPFASMHEAYAVIKEEMDEVDFERDNAQYYFENAWENIKKDNPYAKVNLVDVHYAAIRLAVEAVQVAAMCKKAQFVGIPVEEEKND